MMTAKEIYNALLAAYGEPRWWSDDAFTVMLQSVLVQNTAWSNVEKTCAAISDKDERKLTPEYIIGLPISELERMISPCGFFKAKARTIHALAAWFQNYGFDAKKAQAIPMASLRKELLAIKGIGAETADVILVYAFYQPSFIVDAYTRRFLGRLGCGFQNDAEIRNFFETGLEKDARVYGWCHWLILEHCISACKKKPDCGGCKFFDSCSHEEK